MKDTSKFDRITDALNQVSELSATDIAKSVTERTQALADAGVKASSLGNATFINLSLLFPFQSWYTWVRKTGLSWLPSPMFFI